jgi:hypothetical protein
MNETEQLNAIIRDIDFARRFTGFADGDSADIQKNVADEKIAPNLAGFYATECAVGAVYSQTGIAPAEILRAITTHSLKPEFWLLLQRFANATWKACQPFQGIERIMRPNFVVAGLLPAAEIAKDDHQLTGAASLLLKKMQPALQQDVKSQFLLFESLLKSKSFSREIAENLNACYYEGQNQEAPLFLTKADETTYTAGKKSDEEIAVKIAGLYALESGLDYLHSAYHVSYRRVLNEILNNSIQPKYKELLQRFANATWKAGQPFISPEFIHKENFRPFDLLSDSEKQKDWNEIEKAAKAVSPFITA